MTRAAEAEHVSQPSVSQAVRELEAELGAPLFHRVGRGLVLTAAGEALVEPARQVLRDIDTGRAAVEAVAGLTAGRLDLVALPTLAADPVAPLVGAFRMQHPGVDIALADPADAAALVELVASGACELGITAEPVLDPGLTSHALVHQDLLAVLPPGTQRVAHDGGVGPGAVPARDRTGGHDDPPAARRRRSPMPACSRASRSSPNNEKRSSRWSSPVPAPRCSRGHWRSRQPRSVPWSSPCGPACRGRSTSSTATDRSRRRPPRSGSSPSSDAAPDVS